MGIGLRKFCHWSKGWWRQWDWTSEVVEKGGESGGRKVKKRVLVMKCNENDNLPCCGENLSVMLVVRRCCYSCRREEYCKNLAI